MHEMALAEELLKISDEAAASAGAEEVLRVGVGVGWLLQVERQSLAFYLEALRRDYPRLEHAVFELDEEAVRVRCRVCGEETEQAGWGFACGACGDRDVEVVAGDRLEVRDMEVRTDDV
jgi:hydrogenase nickel incorporation protein HypA/HybF